MKDNVSAGILAAQGHEESMYNEYNVATNRKTTCEELVEMIRANLPFDVTVEYRGSTPGDQYGIFCDYGKIQRALGWTPKIRLEDGLAEMCSWTLAQMQGREIPEQANFSDCGETEKSV